MPGLVVARKVRTQITMGPTRHAKCCGSFSKIRRSSRRVDFLNNRGRLLIQGCQSDLKAAARRPCVVLIDLFLLHILLFTVQNRHVAIITSKNYCEASNGARHELPNPPTVGDDDGLRHAQSCNAAGRSLALRPQLPASDRRASRDLITYRCLTSARPRFQSPEGGAVQPAT